MPSVIGDGLAQARDRTNALPAKVGIAAARDVSERCRGRPAEGAERGPAEGATEAAGGAAARASRLPCVRMACACAR